MSTTDSKIVVDQGKPGIPPVALDLYSEEFLVKVSVMNQALHVGCQKRFPVSQTNFKFHVSSCKRLSRLSMEREHGIIAS